MGTFNIPYPTFFIGFSLAFPEEEIPFSQVQSFRTSYLNDPWIIPSPYDLVEENKHSETFLPLFVAEITS